MAAALLWALAAGSAALWWLHFPRAEVGLNAPVDVAPALSDTAQATATVARALGHSATPVATPDAQRRFQLLGVIAASSGQGSALLAVDGQPAQAFVQGQAVADGWQLQSLSETGARLSAGAGGPTLELALAARP